MILRKNQFIELDIVSCSPNPATESETANSNFHNYLDHNKFYTSLNICYYVFCQQQFDWLKES